MHTKNEAFLMTLKTILDHFRSPPESMWELDKLDYIVPLEMASKCAITDTKTPL